MYKIIHKFFLVLFLFFSSTTYGQATGSVTDVTNGKPIANAWLYYADLQVQTDKQGNFTLSILNDGSQISVFSLGYEKIIFTVDKDSNYYHIQLSPIIKNLDEVVITGRIPDSRHLLLQSISKIPENYLPTTVPLEEKVTLQVYKPGTDADISVDLTLYWYNKNNAQLSNYGAYIANDAVPFHKGAIDLKDYLFNYNDFPYADFYKTMLHVYNKQKNLRGITTRFFPDLKDDEKNKVYTHLVLLNKLEDLQKNSGVNIISEFLIDKISGAFKRVRFIYLPDNFDELQEWIRLISLQQVSDNTAIEDLLADEHKKVLYFNVEFSFDSIRRQWYPAMYELKNNLLYYPYLEGTGKDRTIWMRYITTEIGNMPVDVHKISFPFDLFEDH